jgi:hypothetical protein
MNLHSSTVTSFFNRKSNLMDSQSSLLFSCDAYLVAVYLFIWKNKEYSKLVVTQDNLYIFECSSKSGKHANKLNLIRTVKLVNVKGITQGLYQNSKKMIVHLDKGPDIYYYCHQYDQNFHSF